MKQEIVIKRDGNAWHRFPWVAYGGGFTGAISWTKWGAILSYKNVRRRACKNAKRSARKTATITKYINVKDCS